MDFSKRFAKWLLRQGNQHPRFGGQNCNTQDYVKPANGEVSIATRHEFNDGGGFFERFEDIFRPQDLTGKDVFDLGCGFGGRTAYFLIKGEPRSIIGLEISFERVNIAKTSVALMCDDERISFAAGYGESLPFQKESYDIILSYDVFEHVNNLPAVLEECYRTLRPGGRLYALFPPYYGPRAHHLDFITTLPFLHHFFSPGTLVEVANDLLKERPSLRDTALLVPGPSYLGRIVLPRLNGTTERDFRHILAKTPFDVEHLTLVPFAWGLGGMVKRLIHRSCKIMLKLPLPFTRDIFINTIRCVLKKPD